MGLSRLPVSIAAALAVAFACAQLFPATSSSFTDSTANGPNTVTAVADWTAPTVASVITQKAEGGAINKMKSGGTFYIYADIADSGNPSAGLGTMTASTANIATVTSATLTAGSWTVSGTTYDARSPLLTVKSGLNSGTFTYSISVSDAATNGPTARSGSITTDTSAFNVSSVSTVNVATAGKPLATDKVIFTYNKAPEPDSLVDGWDGTSKSVPVKFADGATYGYSGTQDVMGVTDASGNPTGLGYVMTNGDYIKNGKTVTYSNSTIVLSGATVTLTLGTPTNTTDQNTDNSNRSMQWIGAGSAIDQFANTLTTTNANSTSVKQF